jgi:PAS domain S-box-containing protein
MSAAPGSKPPSDDLAPTGDQLARALNTARLGLWSWSLSEKRGWWSERVHDILGLPPGEPAVERHLELIHPDDREALFAAVRELPGDGEISFDYRIVRPDGALRWLSLSAAAEPGADGRPDRLTGVVVDITDRRIADERLRATRERQAFLLSLGDRLRDEDEPDAIMAITNEALGRHLGALRVGYGEIDPSGEYLTLRSDWTDGVPSNAGRFLLASYGIGGAEESRAGRTFVSDDVAADPRVGAEGLPAFERWGVAALIAVPLIKHGRFTAVLSVQSGVPRRWTEAEIALVEEVAERTWDALERARAEAESKESQAMLTAFLENAPASMYLKDEEGRYLIANSDVARRLGVPLETIVGRTVADVASPEVAAYTQAREREVLAAGKPQTYEQSFALPGGMVHALGTRFPVPDAHGRLTRVGCVLIDITAQKRAEEELARSREALHQSEKLTALGSLLAGVSHELNNPLAIMIAQSGILEDEAQGTPLAERGAKVRAAAERCAKIVQTFLALARQRPPERSLVDINATVRAALDLTDYGMRTTGIAVRTELTPDLPPVEADADQLHQVLTNLLVNAHQALQEVDRDRRLTVLTRALSSPPRVEIDIIDNGAGIPDEVRRRVFEPFFTTKPQGVGTGLGLSYSLGVIEAHGGTLALLDRDEGAAFRVTLPAAVRESPAGSDDAAAVPGYALIVDDEPELAGSVAELLETQGYRSLVATSGAEATRLLRDNAFDLVLSDLRMPDLDGPSLHAWILSEQPRLASRLGFTTGDSMSPAAADFLKRTGCPYIEKPFSPKALRLFVAGLAERSG